MMMKKAIFFFTAINLFSLSVVGIAGSSTNSILATDNISTKNLNNMPLDQIFDNTTVWEDLTIDLDEGIVVTNSGNLTIINCHINFTATDSGFVVENDSVLLIADSTIEFGGSAISGETEGVVDLSNVTLSNFSDDIISLENDYSLAIDQSILQNGEKDGIDLEGLPFQVNITNSKFRIMGKDGINSDETALYIDNCSFSELGDEGIQSDGTASKIAITNTKISDSDDGDGIKIGEQDGPVTIQNVTIEDAYDDGIHVENGETVLIVENVTLRDIDENGLEISNATSVVIGSSTFTSNGIRGIEIVNSTTVSVEDSFVTNNDKIGLYGSMITTLKIQYTNFTGNLGGGIEVVDVENARAHYNRFLNNNKFAINATALGTDRWFNASRNYWGTLNETQITVLGSVNITPILDSDLEIPSTETSSEETKDSPHSTLSSLLALLGLAAIAIHLRRKKKLKLPRDFFSS